MGAACAAAEIIIVMSDDARMLNASAACYRGLAQRKDKRRATYLDTTTNAASSARWRSSSAEAWL